mmetsp:Transcript_3148/g.12116  ORF Transcript_3148/g.12116 Transcript_3148/m.12116 type:complete len:219 (+) Transcript_3148:2394-3050(+)
MFCKPCRREIFQRIRDSIREVDWHFCPALRVFTLRMIIRETRIFSRPRWSPSCLSARTAIARTTRGIICSTPRSAMSCTPRLDYASCITDKRTHKSSWRRIPRRSKFKAILMMLRAWRGIRMGSSSRVEKLGEIPKSLCGVRTPCRDLSLSFKATSKKPSYQRHFRAMAHNWPPSIAISITRLVYTTGKQVNSCLAVAGARRKSSPLSGRRFKTTWSL